MGEPRERRPTAPCATEILAEADIYCAMIDCEFPAAKPASVFREN